MYAIVLDLDMDILSKVYTNASYTNAYNDIRLTLEDFGFTRQQGSVYFGNEKIDAVKVVLAAQALARKYSWFTPSVRDIRMLRIEDDNDLKEAILSI